MLRPISRIKTGFVFVSVPVPVPTFPKKCKTTSSPAIQPTTAASATTRRSTRNGFLHPPKVMLLKGCKSLLMRNAAASRTAYSWSSSVSFEALAVSITFTSLFDALASEKRRPFSPLRSSTATRIIASGTAVRFVEIASLTLVANTPLSNCATVSFAPPTNSPPTHTCGTDVIRDAANAASRTAPFGSDASIVKKAMPFSRKAAEALRQWGHPFVVTTATTGGGVSPLPTTSADAARRVERYARRREPPWGTPR
mmetsp:Transcript_5954/g.19815  ORF Transcript_5954/g.19815 Transcript_5954/m.19815 type:complete len:254 (-) Transcript_5954:182-943(-)